MAAIVNELPGKLPSIRQRCQRPTILLDGEPAQEEDNDSQAEMAGHLHHHVGDVARADLSTLQQEETCLHEEDQAPHTQQPQPVDVSLQGHSSVAE